MPEGKGAPGWLILCRTCGYIARFCSFPVAIMMLSDGTVHCYLRQGGYALTNVYLSVW